MLWRVRYSAYGCLIFIAVTLAASVVGLALPGISNASGVAFFILWALAGAAVWLWGPKGWTVYRLARS